MTRPLVALAALLISAPLTAQNADIYRPDSTPPARVTVSGVVDVPLVPSLVGRAPLPVVNVMVNGKGPFRFGIETGAHFVAVSPALVNQLGLTRTGGPDDSPGFRADSMTIGGATFADVPVTQLSGASGVDGLLGWPFWSGVRVTIDYPAGRLQIIRDSLPAPDGRSVLVLTRLGDFWGAPVTIGGHSCTAVVDTRSTGGIGVTPELAGTLSFQTMPVVVGRAGGAAIAPVEVKRGVLTGDVTLGQYTFLHPPISIRPLPPAFPQQPILGAQVLNNFVVSLDVTRGRIELERRGRDTIAITDGLPGGPPPPAAVPQDTLFARLTHALDSLSAAGQFSGVAVIAKDGVPLYQRAYGQADIAHHRANTVGTVFNVGSINKIFTNIAIHQLVAEGRMSLDSTVGAYWPDYPNAEVAKRVTVRELVEMRSGLGGDVFGAPPGKQPNDIRKLGDFLPLFVNAPPLFPPGTDRKYCNPGYVLLGLLIERVTGESYYDYVREHIYRPAGMSGTAHYAIDSLPSSAAIGYTVSNGEDGPDSPTGHPNSALLPGRGSSAGGGYSTAGDLVRFVEALRERKITDAPGPGLGIAGGTAGVNAIVDGDLPGGYDVVVLTNLDPPAAMTVGRMVRGWLGARE